jgi:hypothetical protein
MKSGYLDLPVMLTLTRDVAFTVGTGPFVHDLASTITVGGLGMSTGAV